MGGGALHKALELESDHHPVCKFSGDLEEERGKRATNFLCFVSFSDGEKDMLKERVGVALHSSSFD